MSQIGAFSETLGSPSASDEVQSYDLAWLLHLVGDIHQPLHATSRYTTAAPHGDNGGNGVKVCLERARLCDREHSSSLHSFWDGAIGTSNDARSAIRFSKKLPKASDADVAVSDAETWAQESYTLAKQAAYVAPIGVEKHPYRLSHDYRVTVGSIAERRIALAGARLATLLNARLQ